jgi:coenzyme PQQ precursor peptide PqqA
MKAAARQLQISNFNTSGEMIMWTKPEFTEMRFGFEVTMYIYNR